jgi:hypothetical protein
MRSEAETDDLLCEIIRTMSDQLNQTLDLWEDGEEHQSLLVLEYLASNLITAIVQRANDVGKGPHSVYEVERSVRLIMDAMVPFIVDDVCDAICDAMPELTGIRMRG